MKSDLEEKLYTPYFTFKFQGRDSFQVTVLRVVEFITKESSWILESYDVFIRGILPSQAVLYKGNKDGDARFPSLKIPFDMMVNEAPELDQKKKT